MDFSKEWKNSDQIIKIDDREFHVHRCRLSLCSPVFELMFHSPFKEKDSPVVELKMKNADQFEEMLRVIYDRTKPITGKTPVLTQLIQNIVLYIEEGTHNYRKLYNLLKC